MPWKETSIMDQRISFIRDYLSGDYTKKALCMHYGISRPTGDKWIQRYRMYGLEGLHERSRRPHGYPPPHQPSPAGSASATPPQGGSDCGENQRGCGSDRQAGKIEIHEEAPRTTNRHEWTRRD